MIEARFANAARLTSLCGWSLRIAVKQYVPLDLVWAELLFLRLPDNVFFGGPLVLVDLHGRGVNIARELRSALGPVHERGEIIVALRHGTAVDQRLGAVGKGVLDRVGVEVLAAISRCSARVRPGRAPRPARRP